MRCPDDFILSQYADGELPEDDNRNLDAHTNTCVACRKRVAAFKAENQLLRRSLQDIELWESERGTAHRKIPGPAWIGYPAAALVAISLLLQTFFDFVLNTKLPAVLDWIQPFSLSGKLNLIANGFFYFLDKGENMITTLINSAGAAVLCLLILGAFIALVRRSRRLASTACLAAMLLAFVVPGHALEIRKADKKVGTVSVAAGETIDDSLIAFADSVDIQGTVTGDLVTFARRINVQGTVGGNLVTFGQSVEVTGKIGGDILCFVQSIRTSGEVGNNIWAMAQDITIDDAGNTGQNLFAFGTNIAVDGSVGRDLTAYGAFLDVGGKIGRDLNLAGEKLSVKDTSVIGRNLTAHVKSEDNVQIAAGANIQGTTNIDTKWQDAGPSKYLTAGFYLRQLLRIAGAFVMGLLLFWLVPGMKRAPLADLRGLLASGGIGFVAAVATPVAAIILAITVVGLPVALVSLLFWLLALYLAKIVVGRFIGDRLLKNVQGGFGADASALIIGLLIVIIAVNLPFIGGILNFLLTLIGLGALLVTAFRMFREKRAVIPVNQESI